MTTDADNQSVLPLDDGLDRLDNADITFFKQLTGIDNNEEFETHLLSIQAEAYEVTLFFWFTWPLSERSCKVYPYPCIRLFWWARYDHITKEYSSVQSKFYPIPGLGSHVSSPTRIC
jgi:hypothetical protein